MTTTTTKSAAKLPSLSCELSLSNGVIDRDATLTAFTEKLDALVEAEETRRELVGPAVDEVFTENPGKPIPMPSVIQAAVFKLTSDVSEMASLGLAVGNYIRANAGKERWEGKKFRIGKGRGVGGVIRWSDYTEKTDAL